MLRFTTALALSLLLAAPAWASEIMVQNAWTRATAPGQAVGAAFMDLRAKRSMSVVGGQSPAAERVELHTMAMQEGVMVMRRVPEISLPAGQTVQLKPGGLHIMLIGLKAPLQEGQTVPLTLQVRDATGKVQDVQIEAKVRGQGGRMGDMHKHHHH
ncbi:MAG: copper chaperone PCu(A)C [Thiobacillaceae bacterium]